MMKKSVSPRFGKLSPRYRFILNLHSELRCSICPECNGKTLVRRVPLVLSVDPDQIAAINKHCRYCPHCDILIVHQDELEYMLVITFEKRAHEVIGNEYLVIGTLDPAVWRRRGKQNVLISSLPDNVHDFKERLELEYVPPHWGPADEEYPEMSKRGADHRRETGALSSSESGRQL